MLSWNDAIGVKRYSSSGVETWWPCFMWFEELKDGSWAAKRDIGVLGLKRGDLIYPRER